MFIYTLQFGKSIYQITQPLAFMCRVEGVGNVILLPLLTW